MKYEFFEISGQKKKCHQLKVALFSKKENQKQATQQQQRIVVIEISNSIRDLFYTIIMSDADALQTKILKSVLTSAGR